MAVLSRMPLFLDPGASLAGRNPDPMDPRSVP